MNIVRIYISPSTQEHNTYAKPTGNTEEYWMNLLADGLTKDLATFKNILLDCGHSAMTLGEMIKASNHFGADIHLALHTNAGGGKAVGTEGFVPPAAPAFGTHMYEAIAKITPTKDRGVKDGSHLAEINQVRAEHRVLLELEFHDNPDGAAWIANNINRLRQTLLGALLSFIEKEYGIKMIKKETPNVITKEEQELDALLESISGVLITDKVTWKKVLKGEIAADPKYLRVIFTRCKGIITEYNIPKRL